MFNTEDEILRRLQEKNLEMAVMFYHWCQRNHLTCYLCGGGCIGAIRHGGFIPWDDDLDFFMPRKDYEPIRYSSLIDFMSYVCLINTISFF